MSRTGALETQLSMDVALERAEPWSEVALKAVEDWTPGGRLTSDVLREWVGDPPGHADAIGAVFRTAKRRGWLRYTGEQVISSRPSAHGRYLRVWERTER